MKRQVNFLVTVVFFAFSFLAVSIAFAPELVSVSGISAKTDKVAPVLITNGDDLIKAISDIKGITLYDYYELDSDIIVTFTVLQETFKKEGYTRIKKYIIEKLVTRYMEEDRKRGVRYYMIGILSEPNVVIEFGLSGDEIDSLEKGFKVKFWKEV